MPEIAITLEAVAVFTAALFVAAIIPGPGVVSLVACALARGRAHAFGFLGGILLGDAAWLIAAATGLAALAQAMGDAFMVIRFGGAAWLIWTGSRMFLSAGKMAEQDIVIPDGSRATRDRKRASFIAGFAVTIGNPKAIIFYLGILPGVLDLNALVSMDLVILTIADSLALIAALIPWIIATDKARNFFRSPLARRKLARFSGAILCLAGVLVILM